MADRIDDIDVRILELLQERGRIKRNQIAEEVGLSLPSVSERMRKLEERGVIRGYHAEVDPKLLNFDITAFIQVRVDGSEHYADFVDRATAIPEVMEIHSVTGQGSHMLKIRVRNTDALERLLFNIQRWPGVHGTVTNLVLSTFKEGTPLPVESMTLYYREDEP